MAGLKQAVNQIQSRVESVLSRADNGRAWLARVAYPEYQNAQMQRWMTQGQSQGSKWRDNSENYKLWKPKKYAMYPGHGNFVMVATGTLAASVIGKALMAGGGGSTSSGKKKSKGSKVTISGGEHRRLITGNHLEVFTTVPYAEDAAKERPFMNFKKSFYDDLKKRYQKWIMEGNE